MDSDFITASYIFILVASPIIFFSIHFWEFKGGVTAAAILSLIVALILAWLIGVGSAWQLNGKGSSDATYLLSVVACFVFCFLLLLFISYGFNQVLVYKKTGHLHKWPFFIWLIILFGLPASYHFSQYWQKYQNNKYFSRVNLAISSPIGLPIYFDSFVFINSHNGRETKVKVNTLLQQKLENPENLQQAFRLSTEQSPRRLEANIPKHADKMIASWYSYREQKFYQDEFPLPKQLFENLKNYSDYWFAGNFELRIYCNGNVDLFSFNALNKNNLQNDFAVATGQASLPLKENIDSFKQQLRAYPDFNAQQGGCDDQSLKLMRPPINKELKFYITVNAQDKKKSLYLSDVHNSYLSLSARKKRQRMYSYSVPWAVKSSFYKADNDGSIVFTIYFSSNELYDLSKQIIAEFNADEIEIICNIEQRSPAAASCYAKVDDKKFNLKDIFFDNSHE